MANFSLTLKNTKTPNGVERRIVDTDLAKALGYKNPRNIRKVIERHKETLAKLDTCSTVERVIRGNCVTEWKLSKKQAIFICTKSETANATAATIHVVEVYDAAMSGKLNAPSGSAHPTGNERTMEELLKLSPVFLAEGILKLRKRLEDASGKTKAGYVSLPADALNALLDGVQAGQHCANAIRAVNIYSPHADMAIHSITKSQIEAYKKTYPLMEEAAKLLAPTVLGTPQWAQIAQREVAA